MSYFKDVQVFHTRFGIHMHKAPALLSDRDALFRLARMHEELAEVGEAIVNQDLTKTADALADLVYFALGTAAEMGLPFSRIWDAVHASNMAKVRGESRFAYTQDVIKPSGWVGPEAAITEAILQAGKWPSKPR